MFFKLFFRFVALTLKQKILLYNLAESCHWLTLGEIKTTIRKILTECGDVNQMRSALNNKGCPQCNITFKFLNELCIKCLGRGFQIIHKFTLLEGIRAFSSAINQIKDSQTWSDLKLAKRHPVILIVDEVNITFYILFKII